VEFGVLFSQSEFAQLRDLAQTVEGLGYHLAVLGDHIVYELAQGKIDPHQLSYDTIVSAAVALEATRTLRVGHLVLNNLFRYPVLTAQSIMTLDNLSGGRVVAGLGTGYGETEFRLTGINFPEMKIRLEMLDEALTCIRSLWTNEQTTFIGKHYQLREAILWPKPIQKPHPPIIIGGGGRPVLRIAAKHAGVANITWEVGRSGGFRAADLTGFDEDRFKERASFLRDEAVKAGRTRDAVAVSNIPSAIAITESEADTGKKAESIGRAFGMTPEQALASPMLLVGTPESCVAQLQHRAREWGVSQFIFITRSEKVMRLLAEQVLPHVVG
jgi:probable F420-dependent oxidoreductase